jgi:hypothetical protein
VILIAREEDMPGILDQLRVIEALRPLRRPQISAAAALNCFRVKTLWPNERYL